MPKTERRVYTFDELDRMLCKRPTRGNFLVSTRVLGKVGASVEYTRVENYITLRYVAQEGKYYFEVAKVWRGSDGDTVYRVAGCRDTERTYPIFALDPPTPKFRQTPEGRALYRKYVQRLTPRDITGRTPRQHDVRWYRIRDGVATQIEAPPKGRPFCWQSVPDCTVPTMKDWVEQVESHHLPKFVARSRAFARNLRRELSAGLPCKMQLLTQRQANNPSSGKLHLHICAPPTRSAHGRRLMIGMSPHNHESREHFQVDGDFAIRHSQFSALEPKGERTWRVVDRWPCARDAIAGIKEWVLSSIFIPGPE